MKLHEIQEDLLETIRSGCELWLGVSGCLLPGSFRHRLSSSTVAPQENKSRANRRNVANLTQPMGIEAAQHVPSELPKRELRPTYRTFTPCCEIATGWTRNSCGALAVIVANARLTAVWTAVPSRAESDTPSATTVGPAPEIIAGIPSFRSCVTNAYDCG